MQKKINLLLISLVIFGILISGMLEQNMMKKNYIEDTKERMISSTKILGEGLTALDNINNQSSEDFLIKSAKSGNFRITIIDLKGQVIFDSEKKPYEMENHKNRPEIVLAYEGKIGVSTRYSRTIKMDMYYVAVPYEIGGDKFVIRTALPLSKIDNNNLYILFNISIASLAAILLSLFIGTRVSNKIIEPIKTLSVTSKRISDGKYDEKVYVKSDDEIGELAHSFNLMSEEIKKRIMEINDRNTKTKAILSSMINGVIAVDNSKKIMFVNSAAEEMFEFKEDNVKGKYILEVLRNSDLDEQIQKMISQNIMTTIEIEVDFPKKRNFNLYSNPIISTENGDEKIGVVIIIQDITEVKKLENMRKDFVANVSHELKTPLTSIKGFIETLLDGASENEEIRDKFLGIINVEVERLNSLIEDLLILSEIEKTEKIAHDEEINLSYSTRSIIEMLSEIAKNKEVSLLYNCESKLPSIYGNQSWFKQMMVNLIDNAIKYNKPGGEVRVNIKSDDEKKEVIISVKDNGVGIKSEHLNRLFERFYRVDKARSRNIGGTGLGLAIVKHVVLSFKGVIEINSSFGEGTEFLVKIPYSSK